MTDKERDAGDGGRIMALLPDSRFAACLSGKWRGWLFRRRPDGQWVSSEELKLVDPADRPKVAAS